MSAKALKIVHVVTSIDEEAAGPSYSVPRLALALKENRCDVELMSLGDKTGPNQSLGVHHHRYTRMLNGFGPLGKLGFSQTLRSALSERSHTSDIIHTHGLWRMPNIYPSMTTHRVSHNVVLSPRGMLSPDALTFSSLTKRLFWLACQGEAAGRVTMFHATSEQEFEDIRAFGLKQPVAVIPNGIDVSTQGRPKITSKRTILFLGRIHPIKQIDVLIEAWARLEPHHLNWCLEIRGPGDADYISHLEKCKRSLTLKRCTLQDPIYGQEKLDAFHQASLFVLPSTSENFGMAVAESLAAGTPVIATKGTPWQGLSINRCGWWIDKGVDALVAALEEALTMSDHELNAMGSRGREWMLRDFSWDAIGRDMAAAYRWVRSGGDQPSFVRI